MLDHRPIRVLDAARTSWPCAPLIAGAWRDVPPSLLIAIAAEGARRRDMDILLPSPIERLRALPLTFYPDWFLVEGLARYAMDQAGVFRMLIGPTDMLLLDGTSPPIHHLNTRALKLGDSATTNQYLRFFCGVVHGDEGPFSIVERPGMIAMNPALTEEQRLKALASIKPIRRSTGARADIRTAAVIYGTALFRSQFRVRPGGLVEMLDDTMIIPRILAPACTYDGIWTIFPDRDSVGRRVA